MKKGKYDLPVIIRPVIPPTGICIDRYRDETSKRERDKDYGSSDVKVAARKEGRKLFGSMEDKEG